MPRGRGLVPVRAGTSRRVTRTRRTAPAGMPVRPGGYACPGRTGPHAGPRTSTTARARGNGGRIEHGSTPRLTSPTPGHTSALRAGRAPDLAHHPPSTPGVGALPGHPPTSIAPGPRGRRTSGRRPTPGPPALGPRATGSPGPGRCFAASPGLGPGAVGPPGPGLCAVGPRPRVTGLSGPGYRAVRPPGPRSWAVGPSGAGPRLTGPSGLGPRATGSPGPGPCFADPSGLGCRVARPARVARSPGGRRTPCPGVERPVAAPAGGGSRCHRDPGRPGFGRGHGCPGFGPRLG